MCERYVLPEQEEAEQEFEPVERWWKFAPSFNVSFSQYVPVVRIHQGAVEGVMMRWGLIPAVAEGVPLENEQPDFDFERLGKTPESREPWLNSQRCIVPAAGFYEWQLTAHRYRQPYFVSVTDQPVFGMAAIWDRSVTEDDDVIESFSILTVPANPLMASLDPIGRRMPAILRRENYATWLSGTPVQAKELLLAYPQERIHAHPVSPRVNSVKYNDPALIRPVA